MLCLAMIAHGVPEALVLMAGLILACPSLFISTFRRVAVFIVVVLLFVTASSVVVSLKL